MTYRHLGDYIREVNVRNRDLKVNLSQGICNDKYFQNPKQVADNPETHKIVRTGQFAYNRATTRNGDKLSIALRQGPDCTVSAAYQVFEVSRPDLLLPEYLMMWFKRPEFDRLALFYSHGSAHEFFEWESMCDVQLPVPSIERQREIVSEYETLTRRIRLNEQMIEKLEATAQALYHKTFVAGIDKQNLPQGWHLAPLGEVATVKAGGDKPKEFSEKPTEEYNIPVYANGIENKGIFGYTNKAVIKEKSITISARGTIGYCFLRRQPYVPIVRLIVVVPHKEVMAQYLYHYMNESNMKGSGSVQSQLTVPDMEKVEIIMPPQMMLEDFHNHAEIIDKSISIREHENEQLTKLQSLLLAKMGQ